MDTNESKVELLIEKIEELQEENNDLRSEVTKLEDELGDMEDNTYELNSLEDKVVELQDHIDTMERDCEKFDDFEGLKKYAEIGEQFEKEVLAYNHRLTWVSSPVEVLKEIFPAKI